MWDKIMQLFLENLWKKLKSIPIFLIIIIYIIIVSLPKKWDFGSRALGFYIQCIGLVFVFSVYLFACIKEIKLPKAKTPSVLFVINTESDGLYKDIQHKLITNFSDCFKDDKYRFDVICLHPEKVAKYNLNKREDVQDLLRKTNCVFFVRVRYHVDSISNTENYEMMVNYEIGHPNFQENIEKLLQTEMNFLSIPIKKRRFCKGRTIENLDFTAQALSVICQYLLSLVLLLSGNFQESYELLHELYSKAENGCETFETYNISILIKKRLFDACMIIVNNDYDLFFQNKSMAILEDMNLRLDEANRLFPETYDYYTGKAYYYVAHDLDGTTALKYVNECRKNKSILIWKYSDAFLTAFFGKSPNMILRKYEEAFKVDHDLLRIVDYIEYILEKVPERIDLHLAAALVYDKIGDRTLAKEHFMIYLGTEKGKKIATYIRQKINVN